MFVRHIRNIGELYERESENVEGGKKEEFGRKVCEAREMLLDR